MARCRCRSQPRLQQLCRGGAVGRVRRGSIRPNQRVVVVKYDGEVHKARVGLVYGYHGLERHEVPQAEAGDIIAITGMEAPTSPIPCATPTKSSRCRR